MSDFGLPQWWRNALLKKARHHGNEEAVRRIIDECVQDAQAGRLDTTL
jgi:hypothetical protein